MHDTFLNEKIYVELLNLCKKNNLLRLNKINIAVNTDSHISEESVREHFGERGSGLVGDWTEFVIDKQEIGKMNVIINRIEGESADE